MFWYVFWLVLFFLIVSYFSYFFAFEGLAQIVTYQIVTSSSQLKINAGQNEELHAVMDLWMPWSVSRCQPVSWPWGPTWAWDVVRQGAVSCVSLAWCLAQPLQEGGAMSIVGRPWLMLDGWWLEIFIDGFRIFLTLFSQSFSYLRWRWSLVDQHLWNLSNPEEAKHCVWSRGEHHGQLTVTEILALGSTCRLCLGHKLM